MASEATGITGSEPRSPLADVIELHTLPLERLKGKPKGQVIEVKKIGSEIFAVQKVDSHFEAAVYDEKGNLMEFNLDPCLVDLIPVLGENDIRTKPTTDHPADRNIGDLITNLGFGQKTAQKIQENWYKTHLRSGNDYLSRASIKSNNVFFPLGDWEIRELLVGNDAKKQKITCFVNGNTSIHISLADNKKYVATVDIPEPQIELADSLKLVQDATYFKIKDEAGKELSSIGGTQAAVDPSLPNVVYYIQSGQVYSLDTSTVKDRSFRPVLQKNIKMDNLQELQIDPHGNFLLVRSGNKLSILDKETGGNIRDFDDVKGPIFVDKHGDIVYVDTNGAIKEVQTNFQSIPEGGTESVQAKKIEQLRERQERFAKLELGKVQRQKTAELTDSDVANTLRQAISRQVSEKITQSSDPEAVEDILDSLQGLKADPANKGYEEIIDEFVSQARDKLSTVRSIQFDSQLDTYEKALADVKSVGDTIGLDEQFAKLLELRQKIEIRDPQKRREIEKKIGEIQAGKDALINRYQGELVEAANQTLPQIEELIRETGSAEEVAHFANSSQVVNFEMMLANIKDPKVRKELRDKYNKIRNEQTAKINEEGRQLEETRRSLWAQVVEEARDDLDSLRAQIEQTSDSKELDRFGRNPLVTAWRAKLFALPPELRDIEERKLEIILGGRKKDLEHRKELGAIGDTGELRFGDSTFPIYKEPPRIWSPKLVPEESGLWAELIFEDPQGRIWRPKGEQQVIVNKEVNNDVTRAVIEQYKKAAEEYFKGVKRDIPDFDEHWRITDFHMKKLEEISEALNLQLANHRGVTILQGEAGTGKNVLVDILANLSNREVVTVACNENTVKEELTYEFQYDPAKGTYRLPSRLIQAIQTPGSVILFDEINALKPGIAKMLNSLFDYRRRLFISEGGQQKEIIVDPTVILVGTMNPQNYAGVNRLSPEVKSRARVIDIDYPPFEEQRGGRTYYRSDEAEMLSAYMSTLSELKQNELKLVWDYVVNKDETNGADVLVKDNPDLVSDVRRIYDVIRVANRLREMYENYQIGDSNEPLDFPTSLREVTDIVMEMNHRKGVKPIVKRVIIPKIDDRRQKRIVEQTIDAVLPE